MINLVKKFSHEAIIVLTELGEVIFASPSIDWFIDVLPKDLINKSIYDYIDKNDIPKIKNCIATCTSQPEGVATAKYWVIDSKRKNKVFVKAAHYNQLNDPDINGIVTSWSDIMDEFKAQAALEKERSHLECLFYNNPEAIVLTNSNNYVTQANESFCKTFGYSKKEVLGKHIDELVAADTPFYGEAFSVSVRATFGNLVDIESVRKKKDGTLFEVAITAVPVIFKGESCGVYTIYRDISEKKKAEEKLNEYVNYLERVCIQAIAALGSTLEKRDPYTAGHQRRVAKLTEAIATHLGLNEDDVKAVCMASPVHDIGKIKIPAEILTKPTSLTPEEYMLVKAHPQVGFEILKGVEFPWPIAEIVYEHHERLDGSGYPQGLKNDKIHPLALVLAVADTVEAMVSDRPYRKALPLETALSEILMLRGKHFDPDVVDACVNLFKVDGFTFDN